MMDRVSKEELAGYAEFLEDLWAEAQQVLKRNWSYYDEKDAKNGKTKRSVELKRVVAPMIDQVEELLKYPVYMGNSEAQELYGVLEDLLATTIARITKLDVSVGIRYRREFLGEHTRSFRATVALHWNELRARVIAWGDDGRR